MRTTTAACSTTTDVFNTDPSAPKKRPGKSAELRKTTIKGGRTQLNLHDGRNIIVDDPSEYNTGDSLKLNLPDQAIIEHIRFGEGTRCYLIGGAHAGSTASVKEYIVKRSSMPNEVQFDDFGTVARNVFAIGDASMPLTEVAE